MTMHLTYVASVPQHTDGITTVKEKIEKDYETNALVRQDVGYACVSQSSSSLIRVYISTRLMA